MSRRAEWVKASTAVPIVWSPVVTALMVESDEELEDNQLGVWLGGERDSDGALVYGTYEELRRFGVRFLLALDKYKAMTQIKEQT